MSDAQLVRQALAGQNGAYEQLVRRWSARVLAVCHARIGRAEASEELAQETLFRGLKALPSLTEPEKFGPWICGIANRACLDWLKNGRRAPMQMSALSCGEPEQIVSRAGDDGPSAVEERDQISRLMSEVDRLPEEYREVLLHYYYDDCTYEELAKLLNVSAATINARLTKARQMLRERLGATKTKS